VRGWDAQRVVGQLQRARHNSYNVLEA